jgi:membrane protease YdiL (CAAX protease family)
VTGTARRTADARDRAVGPAPSLPQAAAVFVAYSVVVVGLMRFSGVAYADFFDTAGSTLRSAVVPLVAGSALLLVVLRWTGWRVRDEPPRPAMGFLWVLPAVMVATLLLRLAGAVWSQLDVGLVAAALLASVLVGFAEETLFRGIILTALRGRVRSEAIAALVVTLWFGLFHLSNLLLGEPAAALQVGLAALGGVGFYLARRGTGTLVAAMVLHGAWDFSAFLTGTAGGTGPVAGIGNVLIFVVYALAVVTLVVVLVSERRRPPVGVRRPPSVVVDPR